jgi:hypothetical protein
MLKKDLSSPIQYQAALEGNIGEEETKPRKNTMHYTYSTNHPESRESNTQRRIKV